MINKTHFLPASEEGHFDGLVVEGKYLRQSLLYKQILPSTPSRPKTSIISVNPVILSISSSCPSCASWLQNPFNPRNPRLINDLRSTKEFVRKIHLFMQNKAKFRKVKINVNKVLTRDYVQLDTWSHGKKQSQTKPNKAKTNPILAKKTTIRTQFKPKRTQFQRQRMLCSKINNQRKPLCNYPVSNLFDL